MLKQFLSVMGRYLKPYRKYLAGSVVLNFLAQWLNVFSFVVLIPILNILFKIDTQVYTMQPIDWSHLSKDVLQNNGYAYVQELIAAHGEFTTLVMMGLMFSVFLAIYWVESGGLVHSYMICRLLVFVFFLMLALMM